MIEDYLSIAIRSLTHRRIRSWLTVIGIFIGIAAVVALVAMGQGLHGAIMSQFELVGADKIIVFPGTFEYGPLGGFVAAEKLSDHDVKVIESVRGVEKAGGMISAFAKVEYKDEIKYTWVTGFDWTLEDFAGVEVEEGREFKRGDKYKAVVGYLIPRAKFFEEPVTVHDKIFIQGKQFEVVGTVSRIGNRQDDTGIYVPLKTAKEIFDEQEYAFAMVKVKGGEDVDEVAETIKAKMRRDRGLKEGKEDFSIQTFGQLVTTFENVLGSVQLVIIGIAGISLLVGGIGIMNTMYTSVLERTREIGIMKAIGARNRDIFLVFLLESGLLGLVGGLIGVGTGVGLGELVEFVAIQMDITLLRVAFPLWLIVGALAFSFFVGVISGVLPAMSAAKLKPVEALRYL